MNEIWKPVKDYEDLYEVSNLGNIRNAKGNILKPNLMGNGYARIGLHRKGNAKTVLVHRLVAEAFIPNPNNYPCVNHKDETRDNNNADNLEWCTYKYNNEYGTCRTRMIETKTADNVPFKCVETGQIFKSLHECARVCNLQRRTIRRRLNGLKNKSSGLHFEYLDNCIERGW